VIAGGGPGAGRASGAGAAGAPGAASGAGAPGAAGADAVADEIRAILATVSGRPEMLDIPVDTPLFGTAVALDSLTGTLLLRHIRHRFGVDVAGEDLNLDALATVSTLAVFVVERASGRRDS
jgi:acyl carrier protein